MLYGEIPVADSDPWWSHKKSCFGAFALKDNETGERGTWVGKEKWGKYWGRGWSWGLGNGLEN